MQHLKQLVSILLDNALRYAPQGGEVNLSLRRQGQTVLLTVTNPGSLSREECRSIFRRFYRLDAARSGGGYGLGLPIARAIAEDHGGKLWAESREGLVILSAQMPLKH